MLRVDKIFFGKRRKRVAFSNEYGYALTGPQGKRGKEVVFSNEYGYVWTGPQGKRRKLKPGTKSITIQS